MGHHKQGRKLCWDVYACVCVQKRHCFEGISLPNHLHFLSPLLFSFLELEI